MNVNFRSPGYLRSTDETAPFLHPDSTNSSAKRSQASSTYGLPPPAYSSQQYTPQQQQHTYRSATMAR